jgi:hypothetical protein
MGDVLCHYCYGILAIGKKNIGFFLDNHREYIKKVIKPITKVKYKDIKKKTYYSKY